MNKFLSSSMPSQIQSIVCPVINNILMLLRRNLKLYGRKAGKICEIYDSRYFSIIYFDMEKMFQVSVCFFVITLNCDKCDLIIRKCKIDT